MATQRFGWTDLVGDDGYLVEWGIASGNYSLGNATVAQDVTFYDITGLTVGVTYYVRVWGLVAGVPNQASDEFVFVASLAVYKYFVNFNGTLKEVAPPQISAGAGDAGQIPALDATGRLDNSMLPVGVGADTKIIVASEALSAGDFVNIWNSTGFKARKADATVAGKEAHGFVLAAVANGANATVYFEGTNTNVTGQAPGPVFLSTTAGLATNTAPAATGNVMQRIGLAISATEINFQLQPPLTLA